MAAEQDLIIKELRMEDCTPDMLNNFNCYQDVKRCWRKGKSIRSLATAR